MHPTAVTTTTLKDVTPNLLTKASAINPQTGALGFDRYNNQTDVWEYDYGTTPGGPARRCATRQRPT